MSIKRYTSKLAALLPNLRQTSTKAGAGILTVLLGAFLAPEYVEPVQEVAFALLALFAVYSKD